MHCKSIVSIVCLVGFASCNNGVEAPVVNTIIGDSITITQNDSNSVSLQKDSVVKEVVNDEVDDDDEYEGESDNDKFGIGTRVSKKSLLDADINITQIYNFPESLQPDGCKQVYFGVYYGDYNTFYVLYALEKDSFSIAYKVEVEEEKSFCPATCWGGSYVYYENGILTRECEENANIYKLHFKIQGDKMVFIGDVLEEPNKWLDEALKKEEDPEKYCALCWGVQYREQWWIDDCLSSGLIMAIYKAKQLIKEGKQEEANEMIQRLENEYKKGIPDDTAWVVLEKLKNLSGQTKK